MTIEDEARRGSRRGARPTRLVVTTFDDPASLKSASTERRAPLFSFEHASYRAGGAAPPFGAVRLPLAPLGGPRHEAWQLDDATVERDAVGDIAFARSRDHLAVWTTRPGDSVERDARSAYRALLEFVRSSPSPWPACAWNVVPRIHGDEAGLERYRAFCRGRADAFERVLGTRFETLLPAASAVGSDAGPLVIALLATRAAPRHLENPRQIAAWRYPGRYGPRSPSFARATRLADGTLLVSGTASVVGHESLHPGDIAAQTRESLRNLDELVEAGDRLASLRVFLRRAEDRAATSRLIEEHVGANVPTSFVRADICREELLVEIEGVAHPERPSSE